jgi:hypothetical protein
MYLGKAQRDRQTCPAESYSKFRHAMERGMKRKFPWFEVVILIGLGVIFALTYWQYKGAQRDLEKHDEDLKQQYHPKQ